MACFNKKKNPIIYQPGKVLILDEAINITIKYKKIVEWMVIIEEQLNKLNLGNEEDFKVVFISAFQAQIK
jgi:hypothetical protein